MGTILDSVDTIFLDLGWMVALVLCLGVRAAIELIISGFVHLGSTLLLESLLPE